MDFRHVIRNRKKFDKICEILTDYYHSRLGGDDYYSLVSSYYKFDNHVYLPVVYKDTVRPVVCSSLKLTRSHLAHAYRGKLPEFGDLFAKVRLNKKRVHYQGVVGSLFRLEEESVRNINYYRRRLNVIGVYEGDFRLLQEFFDVVCINVNSFSLDNMGRLIQELDSFTGESKYKDQFGLVEDEESILSAISDLTVDVVKSVVFKYTVDKRVLDILSDEEGSKLVKRALESCKGIKEIDHIKPALNKSLKDTTDATLYSVEKLSGICRNVTYESDRLLGGELAQELSRHILMNVVESP